MPPGGERLVLYRASINERDRPGSCFSYKKISLVFNIHFFTKSNATAVSRVVRIFSYFSHTTVEHLT